MLANLSASDAEREAAINRGLAASPDVETNGWLLPERALLIGRRGQAAEAAAVIHGLAADLGTPIAVASITRVVWVQLRGSGPMAFVRG